MRVLVADPSRFVRNVFTSMCAARNIDVVQADSGCEALIALERDPVDLAFVALELGDMSAADLMCCLRANTRNASIPLVAITGNRDKATADAALLAGFTECHHKSDLAHFERFLDSRRDSRVARLHGTVLLVEDSAASAALCTAWLGELGLNTQAVSSAEKALERLQHEAFTVIITDFVLDGRMTGLDLIRAVRAAEGRLSHTPILALTAHDSPARRLEILRAGANDYSSKPLDKEEFGVRVRNLALLSGLFARLEAQHETIRDLAQRDALTGLYNRHRLNEMAPELVGEAHRTQAPLSACLLDIDHFKRVNDTHGHAAGDSVLVAVANVILSAAPPDSLTARFGGEEMVVLMPDSDLKTASRAAERLRRHVEALSPRGIPVTCSIGVAALRPDETYEQLFDRADAAVYEAKREGRNQVIAHQ